jgi:hypothetical protein
MSDERERIEQNHQEVAVPLRLFGSARAVAATAPCVTACAEKGLGTKDTFATQNQFAFQPE